MNSFVNGAILIFFIIAGTLIEPSQGIDCQYKGVSLSFLLR